MGESKIELKSVSELLGMKFFIPSYQRGYRWTKSQITALLQDIWSFDESKDGEFYCIQPLVVRMKQEPSLEEIKKADSIETVRSLLKGAWAMWADCWKHAKSARMRFEMIPFSKNNSVV